jgi:type IV pilus assembly protein PilA
MKPCAVRGYSLIELMTVVGIIALMAAMAIPIYHDYAVRTRVAEGLAVAAAAKTTVVINAATAASDLSAGYVPPTQSENVASVIISPLNGSIDIVYTAKAGALPGASDILLVPRSGGMPLAPYTPPLAGAVLWNCTQGALATKYRPTQCRL